MLHRCMYILSSSSVKASERGGCFHNFNLLFLLPPLIIMQHTRLYSLIWMIIPTCSGSVNLVNLLVIVDGVLCNSDDALSV